MPFDRHGVWYPPPGYTTTTFPLGLPGIQPEQLVVVAGGRGVTRPLLDYIGNRQTQVSLQRSTTQASTIKVTIEDDQRQVLRSPLATQAFILAVPTKPVTWYKLVGVGKSGNALALTFENYYVWVLRRQKGVLTQSAKDLKNSSRNYRGWWVAHLCDLARVPSHIAPRARWHPLKEPMTRGSSNAKDESSWDAITRTCKDIQARVFDEGAAIWCGPDWWFQTGLQPATPIAEYTDAAIGIDFDYDVGKPVSQVKITSLAHLWPSRVGLARPVNLSGLGPANGTWLVTEVDRQNMAKAAMTVTLERFASELPEPAPQGAAHTVSFTAH